MTGRTNAMSKPESPVTGFMPTEYSDSGRVIAGRWYGESVGSYFNTDWFPELTRIEAPDVTSITMDAFSGLTSLTTAIFPMLEGIPPNGFSGCTSLTAIDFSRVVSIGSWGLQYCTSLTAVDFPLLNSIGGWAFGECSNLTALILRSPTVATLHMANAIGSTPIGDGTGHAYVPRNLVNSYKTETNWAFFANQIRAIEDYPEITGG